MFVPSVLLGQYLGGTFAPASPEDYVPALPWMATEEHRMVDSFLEPHALCSHPDRPQFENHLSSPSPLLLPWPALGVLSNI